MVHSKQSGGRGQVGKERLPPAVKIRETSNGRDGKGLDTRKRKERFSWGRT